jgi:hypothetical protein
MQFPDQRNISLALLGKSLAVVADTTLVNDISVLADGNVAILDKDNKSINSGTLTATQVVRFVQRVGDELMYSPFFKVGDATCKLSGYTAPAEQVSYIGYNGSAGSLDVIDSTNFVVNVHLVDATRGNIYQKFGAYKSVTSATQVQIATGLVNSLIRQFAVEPISYIRFSRTSNGSVAVFTGSSTITKFTKGSTTVKTYIKAAAGNVTLTASTASVAVNDVINIPSIGGRTFTFVADTAGSSAGRYVIYIGETSYNVPDAGTAQQNADAIVVAINAGTQATATDAAGASTTVTVTYNKDFYSLPPLVLYSTDDSTFSAPTVTIASGDSVPVKYIAAATTSAAATFELDVPYQGETGYAYEGTVAATNAGIATTNTLWGIKMAGNVIPFQINKYPYQKTNFTVSLTNFTATTVTGNGVNSIGSAPNPGVNVYEQVAEALEFCNYNQGKTLRGIYLTSEAIANPAVAGTKYECATITAKKIVSSGLGQPMESPVTIYLFFVKDSAQGDAIAVVLNGYYSSGAFPA